MRNINAAYSALSELQTSVAFYPGATRLALLDACPWLPYFAPSALWFVVLHASLALPIIFRAVGAALTELWVKSCFKYAGKFTKTLFEEQPDVVVGCSSFTSCVR